jgi:site-specific DNA-methyltransferase (adenine-specific)
MSERIAGYEIHPVAAEFPLMSAAELGVLADDIRQNGQAVPIVRHKGLIIDGRNRLRACEVAGVQPVIEEWKGDDTMSVVAWITSVNIARRHLNETQREALAARLLPHAEEEARSRMVAAGEHGAEGGRGNTKPPVPSGAGGFSRAADEVAAVCNVSSRQVQRAKRVEQTAAPEVKEEWRAGNLPTSAALKVSKLPESEQVEVVQRLKTGDAKNVDQAIRQIEADKRRAAPITTRPDATILEGDCLDHIRDLAARPHCVVTDPPYGIEVHNTRRGDKDYADGTAYALDLFDELCALLVTRLDPSAHLYVFAGYTHVAAFKAILAKHFDVQDNPIIWVKENHTMCDFSKNYPNKHEYILFAKMRGSPRRLTTCVPDVIQARRTRESDHSAEKPTELLCKLIEQSTAPGEVVLDPFAGSGSTGVAALETGRRFVGIEVDPKWAQTARARVGAAAPKAAA